MGAATQWIESDDLHNGGTKSPDLEPVRLILTAAFQRYQVRLDRRRTGGDMGRILRKWADMETNVSGWAITWSGKISKNTKMVGEVQRALGSWEIVCRVLGNVCRP